MLMSLCRMGMPLGDAREVRKGQEESPKGVVGDMAKAQVALAGQGNGEELVAVVIREGEFK